MVSFVGRIKWDIAAIILGIALGVGINLYRDEFRWIVVVIAALVAWWLVRSIIYLIEAWPLELGSILLNLLYGLFKKLF